MPTIHIDATVEVPARVHGAQELHGYEALGERRPVETLRTASGVRVSDFMFL